MVVKTFITRCAVGFLAVGLMVLSVHATPIGPVRPDMGRFSLEFEVASDRREMVVSNNGADKREVENLYLLSRASYGMTDNVEITVRLGATGMDYVDRVDNNGTETTFGGSSQLTWGIGIGAILYDAGTWNLGGVANYLSHNNHSGSWPGVGSGGVVPRRGL